MFLTLIYATAEVASFRVPEMHTYQKTFPLPPPTTIVGLLGSALDLPMSDVQTWVKEHQVSFGVSGEHKGFFKDLWKYQKVSTKAGGSVVISAVVMREYLAKFSCCLVFGSPKKETADKILQSFFDPGYALAAGSSDLLILVSRRKSCVVEKQEEEVSDFRNVMLPCDIVGNYDVSKELLNSLPIVESLCPPEIYSVPFMFSFDKDGVRSIAGKKMISFVGHQIKLKTPLRGFKLEEGNVVLSSI